IVGGSRGGGSRLHDVSRRVGRPMQLRVLRSLSYAVVVVETTGACLDGGGVVVEVAVVHVRGGLAALGAAVGGDPHDGVQRRRAGGDARATARMLQRLFADARRQDVDTWEQLETWLRTPKPPPMRSYLPQPVRDEAVA